LRISGGRLAEGGWWREISGGGLLEGGCGGLLEGSRWREGKGDLGGLGVVWIRNHAAVRERNV